MNEIEPALRRAYALGQKYRQQADSDFARDNRKADETQAKFNQLVESMQGWLSPAEADKLLCAACERNAVLAGLPSAYELAGRHVHLGKLKAVQTCCVGEPS